MNFDTLHDHIDQNYHLVSFGGPRIRSKLIHLISNTFKKRLEIFKNFDRSQILLGL